MSNPRPTVKFTSSKWTKRLVPLALAFLVLILLAALVITGLSLMGVTPSA